MSKKSLTNLKKNRSRRATPRGGSHPDESYDKQLLDDPAYKAPSVYVPDDIKDKIDKWASDMGLKEAATKNLTIEIFDLSGRGETKKLQLTHEYIVNQLGFSHKRLSEARIDQTLQDEIYTEHILSEGFIDSITQVWEKVKKKGGDTAFVVKSLKSILTDPSKVSLAQEQSLSMASRYFGSIAGDKKINPNIKVALTSLNKFVRSQTGWKGLLASLGFLILLSLMNKGRDWLDDEKSSKKLLDLINNFSQDVVMDPSSYTTLSGWLSKLAGSLAQMGSVLDELNSVFRRLDVIQSGAGRVQFA